MDEKSPLIDHKLQKLAALQITLESMEGLMKTAKEIIIELKKEEINSPHPPNISPPQPTPIEDLPPKISIPILVDKNVNNTIVQKFKKIMRNSFQIELVVCNINDEINFEQYYQITFLISNTATCRVDVDTMKKLKKLNESVDTIVVGVLFSNESSKPKLNITSAISGVGFINQNITQHRFSINLYYDDSKGELIEVDMEKELELYREIFVELTTKLDLHRMTTE